MQSIETVFSLLNESKKILITHHNNADYDAMGSSLALCLYLKKLKHEVTVVSPNLFPNFMKWMPGIEEVLVYEENADLVEKELNASDLIFCLDFNTLSRTKNFQAALENASAQKVLIDHHLFPEEKAFTFGISEPEKSSTSEMVFDFIQNNAGAEIIDQAIATNLYIGVVSDTGGFKFPSTSPATLVMASELLKTGIQSAEIQEKAFDNKDESYYRLLGHLLSDNMIHIKEAHASILSISKSIYKNYNIQAGGTEGLVNYPLGIKNIIFSTFIVEKDDEIKMSFRSQGNFDVNTFARENFEGGGHKNAAGGRSKDTYEETILKLKQLIENNKKQLQLCYEELQQSF